MAGAAWHSNAAVVGLLLSALYQPAFVGAVLRIYRNGSGNSRFSCAENSECANSDSSFRVWNTWVGFAFVNAA